MQVTQGWRYFADRRRVMKRYAMLILTSFLCLVSTYGRADKWWLGSTLDISESIEIRADATLDGVAKDAIEYYKVNLQNKSYLDLSAEEKNRWRDCLLIILVYQDKLRYESAGIFFSSRSDDLNTYGRPLVFYNSTILADKVTEWNVPIEIPNEYDLLDKLNKLSFSKDLKGALDNWVCAYKKQPLLEKKTYPWYELCRDKEYYNLESVEKCFKERKIYRNVLIKNYYDGMEGVLTAFSKQVEEMPFDEGKEKFRNWIFEPAKLLNEILTYHAYKKDFELAEKCLNDEKLKLLSSPEYHEDLFLRINQAEKLYDICIKLMKEIDFFTYKGRFKEVWEERYCLYHYWEFLPLWKDLCFIIDANNAELVDTEKRLLNYVKNCQQRSLALFVQDQLSNPVIRKIGIRENLNCEKKDLLNQIENGDIDKFIEKYLEERETLKALSKEKEDDLMEIANAIKKSMENFPYVVLTHYARKYFERKDFELWESLSRLKSEIKLDKDVETLKDVQKKLEALVAKKRGGDERLDEIWIKRVLSLPDRVTDNNEIYPIRSLENLEQYVLELVNYYEQIQAREEKPFWEW